MKSSIRARLAAASAPVTLVCSVLVLLAFGTPARAQPGAAPAHRPDVIFVPSTPAIVDAMLTNFHLPKSTLFMLVCAFSGCSEMQAAYAHAIASNYRFYSYGDACLLLKKNQDNNPL